VARIRCVRGDITQLKVEALVNAAHNHLHMGAGVAGALKRVGGREIEEEAVKKGPIPVGEALATGVIHAAVMGADLRTDAEKIRSATRNSLLRAKELGVKSIAYPALGTGVGGFPYAEAAGSMLDETRKQLAAGSSLEEVIFVLWGDEAYRAFVAELGESA
jgi:O-acetyl-ADP-ribose deacetylase (regulator of RNase III)